MTAVLERDVPSAFLRWEPLLVCLLGWAMLVSIPWSAGALGLSWDALNHHIYLGWTAEHARFDRDFVAAGYQSYQFPYLYWPIYKMAALGWTGAAAGVVLATMQALALPPVWMLARACLPGTSLFDVALRGLAVVLAFSSGVVLSMLDSSQNDLLAAVPMLWALALGTELVARPSTATRAMRYVVLSGAFAGLAVAAKLSNAPLAIVLPALWALALPTLRGRLAAMVLGSVAAAAAFALAYGYWGLQLWEHFGNPVFPFFDHWFAPLRPQPGGGGS